MKRRKIIIFTVAILVMLNLIMNFFVVKPHFKATATLMLGKCYPEREKKDLVEIYRNYDFALQVQEKLKLAHLPPTPELEITEGDILTLSVFCCSPREAVEVCNAFLSKFENEEKKTYEQAKLYLKRRMPPIEEEIAGLKEERSKLVDCIVKITDKELEMRMDKKQLVTFPESFYLEIIETVNSKLSLLESELKCFEEKLGFLRAPIIITPSLEAKNLGISKKTGLVISVFIGLIIGIGITFIVEHLNTN